MATAPARHHQPPPGGEPWLRWVLAAAAGIACSVCVAAALHAQPIGLVLALAPCPGVLVMLGLAPWSAIAGARRGRQSVTMLAAAVRRVRGDAAASAGAGDALGELERSLPPLLAELEERRGAVERWRRGVDESIRQETERRTALLRREASTDVLTGLGNRRLLEQRLVEGFGAVSVVAMALDVDHFKRVNDTLGHEVGDGCLRFLGDLLRSGLRREDLAVRLGGDEFIILMPELPLDRAASVGERLVALFRQMPWPHDELPRPSLSIGIARREGDELADGRTLLREADQALYEAKRAGRSRVRVGW